MPTRTCSNGWFPERSLFFALLNVLEHPILFAEPRRATHETSAWHAHIPFAMLLVELLRPRVLVELGTHYGDSYCAFCQAVAEVGADTSCFAIDTWAGDPQAGYYGVDVFEDLRAHHDPLYGSFSSLLRTTFDEAVHRFEPGSIDLLHIDGLHTYEAVKHDFETWLPKLSPRGIVLFHDTAVREGDFGVWRLWEELSSKHPSFEFQHGYGLGVVAVGPNVSKNLRWLLDAGEEETAEIQALFAALGSRFTLRDEVAMGAVAFEQQIEGLRSELEAHEKRIAALKEEVESRETALAMVVGSRTWRLVTPFRVVGSRGLSTATAVPRFKERLEEMWYEKAHDWVLLGGRQWLFSEGSAEETSDWRASVTVGGVPRPAHVLPGSHSLVFRLRIPSEAAFRSWIGLVESSWGRAIGGVTFRLTARTVEGQQVGTWSRHVKPLERRHDRRWIPFHAGLESFAGQEIELVLSTVPAEGDSEVQSAWGFPAVVYRRPAGAFRDVVRDYFGKHGLRRGFSRALRRATGRALEERALYRQWIYRHEPSQEELERQRTQAQELAFRPTISIVTPVKDTPRDVLTRALDSVRAQTYPFWELCLVDDGSTDPGVRSILREYADADSRIRVRRRAESGGIVAASIDALEEAAGEFVALLDHDDELAPDALFAVARVLNEHPDADMIYSDEDKLDEHGERFEPFFKPDWSPDYLLSCMYTLHLSVYRRALVEDVGGFRPGFDGAQDWDLALRVSERARDIVHIPRVLYHWRVSTASMASGVMAKPYAMDAAKRALNDHLRRNGLSGRCEPGPAPGVFRVRYSIVGEPLVSVIVPTAGTVRTVGDSRFDPLLNCVRSVLPETTYRNFELLCVDDGRLDPATEAELDALGDARIRRLSFTRPFNFAAKVNFAVEQARGEHLLLLNDDTEILSPEWMTAMLELSQLEGVGAVGAKLLYPGGGIQHAGVIVPRGSPTHVFQGFPEDHSGYFENLKVNCNYSAVTAACMMTPRAVFDEVGGFCEDFPLNYNDVDYCLKVTERGYRVVFTPFAELRHFESLSRDGHVAEEELALLRRRWGDSLERDRFYNPNLDQTRNDFALAG